ncbi:MAG: hypothetical protein HWN67_00295, partial [Candidatus Helarchaeota archaeon]|nr:hypothetical protein [Candidatus Helarchaeota archaeon]
MKNKLIQFYRIVFLSFIILLYFSLSVYSQGKGKVKNNGDNNAPQITSTSESEVQITSIKITPEDTVVTIDSSFTFSASAYDINQNLIDTTFIWSLSDSSIGTIDSTG